MNNQLKALQPLTTHLPLIAAIVIAVFNVLISTHTIVMPGTTVDALNGILTALGLSGLHINSL